MTALGLLQICFYIAVLVVLVKPLGAFMAAVYEGERTFLSPVLGPVERCIYRLAGVEPTSEIELEALRARGAAVQLVGFVVVYLLQRLQGVLPLNPQGFAAVSARLLVQHRGELRHQHQLAGLRRRIDDELSHADARARRAELRVRRHRHGGAGRADSRLRAPPVGEIGNFWVDLTRSTLYILLPLSLVLALVLVSQGVVQSFSAVPDGRAARAGHRDAGEIGAGHRADVPLGPAASQIAIKQLGTNGGGFFNVNSAHPFENPTPLSNFLEVLAILLIPAALCYTFGRMVRRHAPGLGGARRDAGDLRAAARSAASPPSSRAIRDSHALGVDQTASRPAGRRQHGRQGDALRHRELRALGHAPPPPHPTAR